MDKHEARKQLESTTSFEFRDGGVVLRDLRLLNVVAALRRERADGAPEPSESGPSGERGRRVAASA